MEVNELSKNARGGTELMLDRLHGSIDPDLLANFQIIPSRVRELKEDKIRIYWAHDLPGDPEATNALGDGRWNRFHRIVFVSNWQMQKYIETYQIPWSMCIVLHNAIEPIDEGFDSRGPKIDLVYHTTPHRGLNILLPVFEKLAADDEQLHLHVFSSFGIYGWDERDAEFQGLFDFCEQHGQITYWRHKPNEFIREFLPSCDIFAYPSIWPETSCLALIEAMSAGLLCVHSNYAALYETAGQFTFMYQMQDDNAQHAAHLYTNLKTAIQLVKDGKAQPIQKSTKAYADGFFNWEIRAKQWEAVLNGLLNANLILPLPAPQFVYRR